MKNFKMISVLMLCAAVLLSGCGASNTVKGTAIGVGGGAAVGAGVGKLQVTQLWEPLLVQLWVVLPEL